jgi:hypothetical protein
MLADNPFFVLECSPGDTRAEIERKAQLLLGMLELGFPSAQTYPTPLGVRVRTSDTVRAAVATLRSPDKRLVAELWARHAPKAAPPQWTAPPPPPFKATAARRKLGWGK